MGSAFSWLKLSDCDDDDSIPPILPFEPISVLICQYIKKECDQLNITLHCDVMNIIQMYIGYIMETTILSEKEQTNLYKLLMEYHLDMNIHSPLTDSTSIKYFKLLFRGKLNKPNDCYKMLKICKDRDNLVMVFHTEFDHVFCLYFREKFRFKTFDFEDDNHLISVTVILLRSRFVYGDNVHLSAKSCPRIGKLKEGKHMKDIRLHAVVLPKYKSGSFIAGDLQIPSAKWWKHLAMASRSLDFVGNELCGGDQFKPSQNDYHFGLKDMELFQLS